MPMSSRLRRLFSSEQGKDDSYVMQSAVAASSSSTGVQDPGSSDQTSRRDTSTSQDTFSSAIRGKFRRRKVNTDPITPPTFDGDDNWTDFDHFGKPLRFTKSTANLRMSEKPENPGRIPEICALCDASLVKISPVKNKRAAISRLNSAACKDPQCILSLEGRTHRECMSMINNVFEEWSQPTASRFEGFGLAVTTPESPTPPPPTTPPPPPPRQMPMSMRRYRTNRAATPAPIETPQNSSQSNFKMPSPSSSHYSERNQNEAEEEEEEALMPAPLRTPPRPNTLSQERRVSFAVDEHDRPSQASTPGTPSRTVRKKKSFVGRMVDRVAGRAEGTGVDEDSREERGKLVYPRE